MKFFYFFIAILILPGCTPIMKKMYGIKNPDVENEKSIRKKAFKYGMDTTSIVTVNSQDFLYALKQQGIPQGAVYDKDGKYVEYRQTDTSCNAGLFQFIPNLAPQGQCNKPDSATLAQKLKKFRDLKGRALDKTEPADFYLLIYWAVWTGKLNKDHVKAWEDLAKANKNCKIKVIKVNLDMQAYWGKNEREKIIRALRNKK
jgi:hypothetical protein